MGMLLKKYHDFARNNGGLPALIKIAVSTQITSSNVLTLDDSKENIEKLRQSIKTLIPDKNIPEE